MSHLLVQPHFLHLSSAYPHSKQHLLLPSYNVFAYFQATFLDHSIKGHKTTEKWNERPRATEALADTQA